MDGKLLARKNTVKSQKSQLQSRLTFVGSLFCRFILEDFNDGSDKADRRLTRIFAKKSISQQYSNVPLILSQYIFAS